MPKRPEVNIDTADSIRHRVQRETTPADDLRTSMALDAYDDEQQPRSDALGEDDGGW